MILLLVLVLLHVDTSAAAILGANWYEKLRGLHVFESGRLFSSPCSSLSQSGLTFYFPRIFFLLKAIVIAALLVRGVPLYMSAPCPWDHQATRRPPAICAPRVRASMHTPSIACPMLWIQPPVPRE